MPSPLPAALTLRTPLAPDSGLTGIQVEPIVLATEDDYNAAINSVRCSIDAIFAHSLGLVFIEAKIKGFDLGNLKPIYERVLNKPDVHQTKGMWNVSMGGEGGKGCRQSQQ